MAEDSHVVPLAPPHVYQRSDVEWAGRTIPISDRPHLSNGAGGCGKCFVYFFTLLVLLCVACLVFALVVFRVGTPKLKLETVQVKDLRYGVANNYATFNLTMVAEIKINNDNFGRFKFQNGSTSVLYGNSTLGVTNIVGGLVRGRKSERSKVFVQLKANDDLARNMNFSSDIGSQLVKLNSYAQLRGEVRVMEIISTRRTSFMNCSMSLNLTSQAIEDLSCV